MYLVFFPIKAGKLLRDGAKHTDVYTQFGNKVTAFMLIYIKKSARKRTFSTKMGSFGTKLQSDSHIFTYLTQLSNPKIIHLKTQKKGSHLTA